MAARSSLKTSLIRTTALIGVTFLVSQAPAEAANVVLNTTGNGAQNLATGETLTVKTGATVSNVATGVTVGAGVAATSVVNNGLIQGTTHAILVNKGGNLTGGVTNTGALLNSGNGTAIEVKSAILSGQIKNSGIIAGEDGITVTSAGDLKGGVVNSGVIVGTSDGLDVFTHGNISGGITNKAGGTIEGSYAGIFSGTQGNISGGVYNSGLISGGQSGIYVYVSGDISGGVKNLAGGVIFGGSTGIRMSRANISGGITNAGTISGSIVGVRVASTSDISGGINNSGLIHSGGTGIVVQTGSAISGGITNSGLINGSGNGIFNEGNVSFITNTGTISGLTAGHGILNSGTIGTITNKGLILAGSGNAGISNNAGATIGTIVNSGTISVCQSCGGSRAGIWNGGGTINSIVNSGLVHGGTNGIFNPGTIGSITNAGTIESAGAGIFVAGGNITGNLANNAGGTISGGSTGIKINTGTAGAIVNSGLIKGNTIGIEVGTGTTIAGGIVNNPGGVISGQTGILVQGGGTPLGGITLNGGMIASTAGAGGTAISLTGLASAVPVNINGGQIIGNVTDDTPANGFSPVTIGGNFTTDGDFSVSNVTVNAGKTFTVSEGNTVSMATMPASAGIYRFGIVSLSSFGNLDVTGGAVSLAPALTQVKVIGTLAVNDQFEIATGTAAETGFAPGTAAPVAGSALWNMELVDGSNALIGGSSNNDYLVVTAENKGAATGANGPVLNVLQSLSGTANPELAQIISSMNSAPTSAALNNVLSAVQPVTDNGVFQSAYELLDTIMDLVDGHLNDSGASAAGGGGGPGHAAAGGAGHADVGNILTADSGTGLSAGNINGGRSFWGQFFGQTAHQTAGAGNTGFSANTAGFAFGADTDRLIRNGVVGAAVSYGNSFVSSKDSEENQATIESYQLSLYGDYDLGNHNFLRGMAAYAFDSDGNTRHNVGGVAGLTAKGSYDASEYTAELKAGHHFYSGVTTFTPGFMVRYLGYDGGSYTESGAGAADLSVNQKYLSLLEVGPTLEAAWNYLNKDGSRFVPAVHVGYRYDLIGDSLDTTSALTGGGGSFTTQGARPDRNRFNLGTDATFYSTDSWEFRAAYDFDARQDYTAHSAVIRATYKF